jgi:hypothetical protein
MDPFPFVFVGGAAGVEQAQNHFRGYGQGAQGYAKRFGAGSNCTFSFLRPDALSKRLNRKVREGRARRTRKKTLSARMRSRIRGGTRPQPRIPCAEGLQLRVTPRDKATWLATFWA